MADWTSGYVSDVAYTYGFYRELTPSLLSFSLLVHGFRPPSIDASFSYCELGFGQGFSLNLLAAANPQGDFWGTDFNPSHAAGAQLLANRAALPNVHIFDRSFAELLETETPQFDIIALHGIYSWISEENRRVVIDFIRRKLKFGGAVYISYNAYPGWSRIMPLREVMVEYNRGSLEPTLIQIEKSLTLVTRLRDLGAAFFQANPGLDGWLDHVLTHSRNYLAHEYYNADLTPFYFADAARELSGAKLNFACQAIPTDGYDSFHLTDDARAMLAEIANPLLRETVRDYFVNQRFRRDLFVKGALLLDPGERNETLFGLRFALQMPRSRVPLSGKFTLGEAMFREDVHGPVLDALANGPRTLRDLMAEPACHAIPTDQVFEAIILHTGLGNVAVALAGEGDAARRGATDRFNAAVLDNSRRNDDLQALASPVTGGGITVTRPSQLFLLAMQNGEIDLPGFAWRQFQTQGQRRRKDGPAPSAQEQNLAALQHLASEFVALELPLLRQLGIA